MSPHATWILGWALLAPAGVLSLWALVGSIRRALRVHFSPAASVVIPLRPRRPQLRVVEADAELTPVEIVPHPQSRAKESGRGR